LQQCPGVCWNLRVERLQQSVRIIAHGGCHERCVLGLPDTRRDELLKSVPYDEQTAVVTLEEGDLIACQSPFHSAEA